MSEIVLVGDVHEGMNFGFKVDPETGISERAMDFHRNFSLAAKYALDRGSPLFIILGDLFDRTHVAPAFRELVRRDVVEPLQEENIEIWILAGNHDQPRSTGRSTSIDDFRGYPNVQVFREPTTRVMEIDSKKVGFLIIPYLHPEQVVQRVAERLDEDVPREQMYEVARRTWMGWIARNARNMQADLKILLGHFYIEGARISSTTYVEHLPDEFSFAKGMIPDEIDMTVFGHIHLHQILSDKPLIIYTGAPERIDWGEREDDKGFISLDMDTRKWEFIKLETRPMIRIAVDVARSENPTRDIMDTSPSNIKNAMLRLEITIKEGMRARIDENKISQKLRDSFHYGVKWNEKKEDKLALTEFTLDPMRLFRDFVNLNYDDHPRREEILEEGERILREVLL
ncbi:MAG: exonuclease SbcCD subunit D [Thermoplasmata archaeon]